MKDLILTLVLLAAPFCIAAAQEPEAPDTVKIIENAEKVIVSRTDDTTLIEVVTKNDYGKGLFTYTVTVEDSIATDSDPSFDFELPFGIGKNKDTASKRIKTSVFTLGHIYAGQRFNYSDKGNVKNSFEVGIRDIIGVRWSRGGHSPSFSVGLGYGLQLYRAQDGFVYTRIGSDLVLTPIEDGHSVKYTGLLVYKLQIPVLFTIPMGSEVKFTFGAVGCFNTYASAQTEISTGNSKIKTTYKGLQQRLFTPEIMCSLGVCDVLGVYASWSPTTLFQSTYGPQLKSWSIGATVNF